jgi:hypothetical protein
MDFLKLLRFIKNEIQNHFSEVLSLLVLEYLDKEILLIFQDPEQKKENKKETKFVILQKENIFLTLLPLDNNPNPEKNLETIWFYKTLWRSIWGGF